MREQLIELLEEFARGVICLPYSIRNNPEGYKDYVEDHVDEILELTE